VTREVLDNSSLALERIRALIDALPPDGDRKLPTERALVDALGVSRRAIRRALNVLESEDLLWRRQGSGTFAGQRVHPVAQVIVKDRARTDLREVMEVRLCIEPQLARMAAARASLKAIERMKDIIARIYHDYDADSYELWDSALHREIARTAGNQFFLTVFDAVDRFRHDDVWRAIRERARQTSSMEASRIQHEAIVEAIAAHDAVRAGSAMLAHIQALNDHVLRLTSTEGLSHAS
jgi:GntR family transcriptional repressor for pyruvate dehydrogenase complex